MDTIRLGRTGLLVSRLCLGTMTFGWSADEATSHAIMDAAVEQGINFFDTADIYSFWIEGNKGGESETIIGTWLQNKRRREVIVATKCRIRMWPGANGEGLNRHHIIHSVEDSLRRLKTDYIDLYQAHAFDANTPIEETLYAFDHLVQSGKVLYIGASNYPAWRLTHSLWASEVNKLVRYETLQPHYSLYHRDEFERELAEVCETFGIGVIPYSPLAAGFATGKYQRGYQPKDADTTRGDSGLINRLAADPQAWDALDLARRIGEYHGRSQAQVALAWLIAQPSVTAPIIGARTVEQLLEVADAPSLRLTPEEITQLSQATAGFGMGERHRV
jgi:aryl-alcohol dehydrogenase-like predicted oxidoreductase